MCILQVASVSLVHAPSTHPLRTCHDIHHAPTCRKAMTATNDSRPAASSDASIICLSCCTSPSSLYCCCCLPASSRLVTPFLVPACTADVLMLLLLPVVLLLPCALPCRFSTEAAPRRERTARGRRGVSVMRAQVVATATPSWAEDRSQGNRRCRAHSRHRHQIN